MLALTRSFRSAIRRALAAALPLLALSLAAAPRARAQTDGGFVLPSWTPNYDVLYILTRADGSSIYGGNFTTLNVGHGNPNPSASSVACTALLRFDASGNPDTSFLPVIKDSLLANSTASVWIMAYDAQGNLLVGGQFNSINGYACHNLARFNTSGNLDTSFFPNIGSGLSTDVVRAIAVQPDGKIVVGGNFASVNGSGHSGIVRLTSAGVIDSAFEPAAGVPSTATVKAFALQSSGDIVAVGNFTSFSGTARNGVVRLTPAGEVDPAFNPQFTPFSDGTDTNLNVVTVVTQPADGKLLIGGTFSAPATGGSNFVRLNPDGSYDATFSGSPVIPTNVNCQVAFSAVQPDGRILVGGTFGTVYSFWVPVNETNVARLFSDGTVDQSFGAASTAESVGAFGLLPNGNLLVGQYLPTPTGGGYHEVRPNAENGIGTIVGDLVGLASFPTTAYTAQDTAGHLTVQVQRTGVANGSGAVNYSYNGGTGTSGSVIWPAGDMTPKTITLPVSAIGQLSQTFSLVLLPSAAGGMTAGGTNSKAAITLTHIFPPSITSAATDEVTAGNPYSYTVTATGTPSSYAASPLPAGLAFNAATGLLAGTPTTPGIYAITLSAANGGGVGSGVLTLTVDAPPPPAPAVPRLTLRAEVAQASFSAGQLGFCELHLSAASAENIVVRYSVSGTAVPGTNYVPMTGRILIPAGHPNKQLIVFPMDSLRGNETRKLVLRLEPGDGYTLGGGAATTITFFH